MDPLYEYQFRLILIGDSTVGKSSLLKYFTEGRCADVCDATVGVDFYARLVQIRPDLRIKLQLWDTAGQEKFRSITRSYYRNTVGVLLCYDITQRSTFEHALDWLHEASGNVGGPSPSGCVFQLVGHKSDLDAKRQVLYEEGEYFAKHNKMSFVETSAVAGTNIEECFLMIAREIYSRMEKGDLALHDGWDGIKPGLLRHSSSNSLDYGSQYGDTSCYC